MFYKLDENKNVVPVVINRDEDYKQLENMERVVKQTPVGDYMVSTVFLTIDHGFGGVPLFFETMVFTLKEWNDKNRDGLRDYYCERYTTYNQALEGHKDVCEKVKAGLLGIY